MPVGERMRALVVARAGAAPRVDDVPRPRPGDHEILVRVHAAALNPVDVAVAGGRIHHGPVYEYPVTLGRDFAGVVDAVGPGASTHGPGDAVFGFVPLANPTIHHGSLAEYVVVDERAAVAATPRGLPADVAAALPLSGTTAVMAVRDVAPGAGDVVLVAGATGSVGRLAVVLAARSGARVIATGRAADGPDLRELGAQEVVDHTGDVVAVVRDRHPRGVDALIYLVAPPSTFASLVGLVAPGGRVATSVHAADVAALAESGIAASNVLAAHDPEIVARLGALAAGGAWTPQIRQVLAFDDLEAAYPSAAAARARGKLVVAMAARPDDAGIGG